MNRRGSIITRFALSAAIILCLGQLSPAVLASEQEDSGHRIRIAVQFLGPERQYSEQDYQGVAFVIRNPRREYLLAEYDPAIGAYIPTGSTGNILEATQFRCSWSDSSSGCLMISGLEENCYTLINWEVPAEYSAYRNDTIVCFSDNAAFLDGDILEGYDGQTLRFTFNVCPISNLPMPRCYELPQLLVVAIGALAGAALYHIATHKKSDSEKSQVSS